MKTNLRILLVVCLALTVTLGTGCTVVSVNRVFPKLAWSWSTDAKEQRREDAQTKANAESARMSAPKKSGK